LMHDPGEPIYRGMDDSFCAICGGSGGDWDGDGVNDLAEAFDDQWDSEHPVGDTHIVTVCGAGGCNSVTVYVVNGDYNPERGHQMDLLVAGAHASIDAGASSFTVSSFTSGNRGAQTAHNRGDAMDISAINGIGVGNSRLLGRFLHGWMGNTTIPIGSQIMAPGNFGYNKMAGASWSSIDMKRVDTRVDSPYRGQTWGYMHRHHIHAVWGGGYGVPEY